MKTINLILCCFLLVQSCAIKKNVINTEIFTSINLKEKYGQLSLGESLSDHIDKINMLGPDAVFLKNEVFDGVQSIQLAFNRNKGLYKMTFLYYRNENFNDKVESYKKDLGEPILKNNKVIWNDGNTQFEISKVEYHNEIRLKSTLLMLD